MLTSLSTLRLMLTTLLFEVCLTLPVPMDEIKELSGDEAVLTLTPSFLRIVFTELMLTPPLADVAPEADCGVEGLLDSVVLALVALLEAFELAVADVLALVLVVVFVSLAEAAPPTPGVAGGLLDWVCCCWSFWRMVDEMDSLMEAADETAETRSVVCLDSTCLIDWSIWEISVDCCRICCCCIWVCCCGCCTLN